MLEQKTSEKMIWPPLKVLKSIDLLLPTVFRLFISDLTHILPNSSSCISLIFTNQTILVIESGVHPFLPPICHHEIAFVKLNLKIKHPPLYEVLFGIIKMLMSNWSTIQSKLLIGRNDFRVKMFMIRLIYFIKLSSTYFVTLSQTKSSYAMTKIHHGLMMKFGKSWIRKMSYYGELQWGIKVTIIKCNVAVVTW